MPSPVLLRRTAWIIHQCNGLETSRERLRPPFRPVRNPTKPTNHVVGGAQTPRNVALSRLQGCRIRAELPISEGRMRPMDRKR